MNKSLIQLTSLINWKRKLFLILLIGSLAVLGIGIACLNFGTVSINPKDIITLLINGSQDKTKSLIIWQLRAPRIVLGILTGAALSTVGGAFQGILRNPLADPYILGVSAGAALGACTGIAFQYMTGYLLSSYLPLFAFIGAMLSLYLVYKSSKISYSANSTGLLLSGVAINFLFSALITVLLALSRRELHSMVFWLMGDLSSANWKKISIITLPVIIGSLILFFSSLDLNALSLGEEALHLGINTSKLRIRIFIIGSIVIATVVSFTGLIGFVGLIIPHIARLLVGPDHRIMLPVAAFLGGAFLILCDVLARTLMSPTEIPIGAITAIIGAPLFIYLLRRKN
jgi:iron complex transport system permease protein